ncbi:conserved Plasmodium protein, unknown function [Plasmodium reichenowi]|uniref:Nucleoplasmin-like domain-containing protein n=1 Tax=Plasmodium reichenowi TaxID=5854 RepID=A0A2P9DBR1_PLARE|nr:conserved Plasmodium protein, unknown function [Plasmodium reichenowi]
MFYGKVVKPDETVVPEVKDGYSVIHLSRACLNNPEHEGKIYVQVEDGNGCYNICCLQKNVCEDTPLDIFLMLDNDVKIKTSGSSNEVHIVGYYEVSFGQDNLDEDEDEFEDEFDNDEVRMLTKKNTLKNSLSNGISKRKKNLENNEDDETNVGRNDEDDEDDDDEDDEDEEEDDDEEDEDDEEDDEDDDDEEEEDEEDEDEEGEDEDDEEDEEEEEEEEEEEGEDVENKKKGGDKKKNKRSLDNKNDGPLKKSKIDDEGQFEKDLVAFLKKNGKSKLTELGKVKKPEGLKMKLGFFIKKHSNVFKFDTEGQIVSLK